MFRTDVSTEWSKSRSLIVTLAPASSRFWGHWTHFSDWGLTFHFLTADREKLTISIYSAQFCKPAIFCIKYVTFRGGIYSDLSLKYPRNQLAAGLSPDRLGAYSAPLRRRLSLPHKGVKKGRDVARGKGGGRREEECEKRGMGNRPP